MAVAFAIIVFKQTIKKIPTGKCDGFEILLQMNPCTLTTYLHNFTWPTFLFRKFDPQFSNNTIKKGNLLFGSTIEMRYSSDRVFEAVQTNRCTTCFRACLHEGGGPHEGEITCSKLPHLTCERDHIMMRDYLDRRVTPPKRVTSPTWSPSPPCKQTVKDWLHRLTVTISRLLIGRDDTVEIKYSRQRVFKGVQNTCCTRCFKDCIVH